MKILDGFHGNLQVHMKKDAGLMYIQLSELSGHSSIRIDGSTAGTDNNNDGRDQNSNTALQRERLICISDEIENQTAIKVDVIKPESKIILEETLQHFVDGLDDGQRQLHWPPQPLQEQKESTLTIISDDSLSIGKSSWLNAISAQIMKNLSLKE